MKKHIWSGFWASIFMLFVLVIMHFVSKESADVRYSLSDQIPIEFLTEGFAKNVQSLKVVNNGDKSVEEIIIIINGNITKHKLKKALIRDKRKVILLKI